MKKQNLLITILLISNLTISGQSLKPLREQIKDKYTLKYGIPIRIVETITDYNNKSTKTKEENIDFSQTGDTITRSRYKNRKLEMANICIYNQDKYKISEKSKRLITNAGWASIETSYYYKGKNLSEVNTTYNNVSSKETKISTKAIIECDSSGNLTDSKLYNSDNILILHETGKYDYKNNKWIYSAYDSIGGLRQQETLEIIPSKKNNENGDVILYAKDSREKNDIFYRVDYLYDEFGNWIEKRIYKLRKKGNNIQNEKLFQKINRKIEYK